MRTIKVRPYRGAAVSAINKRGASHMRSVSTRRASERHDYVAAYRWYRADPSVWDPWFGQIDDPLERHVRDYGLSEKGVQRRISVRRGRMNGVARPGGKRDLKRLEAYLERLFQQGFLSGLGRFAPKNSGNLRKAGMFKLVVNVRPMGSSYTLENPSKEYVSDKYRIALVIKPNPAARGAAAKDAYYEPLVRGGEDIRGLWTHKPDGVLRRVERKTVVRRDKKVTVYYVKKRLNTRAFQFNRYSEGTIVYVSASDVFTIGNNETVTRPAQPNNFLDLAGKEGLRAVERYLNTHGYFTMRVDPKNPARLQASVDAGRAERTALLRARALSYLRERIWAYTYDHGGSFEDHERQFAPERAYLFKARSHVAMSRAFDRLEYERDVTRGEPEQFWYNPDDDGDEPSVPF